MQKLIITYKDYVHCTVHGLTSTDLSNCVKKFKIFIPSARYQPTYKLGVWDGYKQYFTVTGLTYVNLIPEILETIQDEYEIEYVYPENLMKTPKITEKIDSQYMSDLKWGKGHFLEGQPVILEEHQVRCVNAMLSHPRGLLQSATSSGKTLMAAALCRKVQQYGKIVYIVPYKDLCFQTKNDLIGFGLDVGMVGAGLREFGHQITICIWHTLNSLEKKRKSQETLLSKDEINLLTKDVVCMIFDETHMALGHQVKTIVEQTFSKVPLRYGITGTIPKEKSDYLCLKTAIGPKLDEQVEAKELQEKGFCSTCDITCVRLTDKRIFMSWQDEKEYLSNDTDRLSFIANLIAGIVTTQKNTLVLIDRIKTGEDLEKLLLKLNINVIFLSGDVKTSKRFEEYEKVKTEDNKCIIAIDKIASTGLNIPRLFNLVFIDYGKSFTKVIQSIGRGLRKANDKDSVTIYDISSTTKYSKKHFNERIHYYDEAQYPFRILNIDNWK